MMECSKCKKWIHAKCEGLLDEHYQVLSCLPESIEFLCRLCSSTSTPIWRNAVQSELRSRFNSILRLLSKNQIARNILKWSPFKSIPGNKVLTSARKLQFIDSGDSSDEGITSELLYTSPKVEIVRSSVSKKEGDNLIDVEVQPKTPISPVMLQIKNKLNSNEYSTLKEFNSVMEQALVGASGELIQIYRSIVKKVFPWYDPETFNEDVVPKPMCDVAAAEDVKWNSISSYVYDYKINNSLEKDTRICMLCKGFGEGIPQEEGRLLYSGQNEWVHANCALWSSEVYEEIDGSLQNVHGAIIRGRSIRCANCKHKGASVGCCYKGCHETYHFKCAQKSCCQFLHDKTVYCSTHDLPDKNNLISNLLDFDIRRPVYVELDKIKKKYVEASKIHFMVGSLSVTSLGKIVPVLSDNFDAIVPSGFTCSRLFWSTEEPWKIIPYVITTSVLSAHVGSVFVDKNFTVDHSLPKPVVERKLKELLTWQKDLEKERSENLEFDDEEEPQNSADILSPELTDAILQELPHDLLDGISVQDMLMSYEELFNIDFKTADMNCNENVNLNVNSEQKKPEIDYEPDLEKSNRELKRSKSEVLSHLGNVDKISKVKNHQRSCSLTWSCKLDNSLAPPNKKRKIASRENNMFFQLLQVDGGCDSSGSECGSPRHETEDHWLALNSEEPVTCEKCHCTYRTITSYKRHLETCDTIFTSESDSEEQGTIVKTVNIADMKGEENSSVLVTVGESEPRVITAYESFSTYQATQNEVHSTILNTQTFVSSESTSEVVIPDSSGIFYPTFQQQIVEPKTLPPMVPSQPSLTISHTAPITITQPTLTLSQANHQPHDTATITINQTQPGSYCVNSQPPVCMNQSSSYSLNQSSLISVENSQPHALSLNQPINQSITINQPLNQTVEIQPQQVTIQSVPFSHEMAPILNIAPQNQITIDAKMITTAPNIVNSMVTQTVVPQNQWIKPMIKPAVVSQKTIRSRAKPRLAAKRARIQTGGTVVVSQPGNSSGPPVIIQHLPSSNMMPGFLDAFQQQTGQNLQYVATITPQINSTLAPQTQLVQVQSDNNFLSLVPGVQPTMILQPRMDQLIVDSSGSVMWATQPVQPVYYGFETIVQNTVLQSSQFLPTTMPGVLTTNSSYSATTQVFQTSKLEPVLDVSQGGFVLLNSGQILNQQLPQSIPQNVQSQIHSAPTMTSKQHNWKYVEPNVVTNMQSTSASPFMQPQQKPKSTIITATNNSNCITLPVAPIVQEQGIPTNIVTPTPKPPTSNQARPMSRVLPMQTNPRETKKIMNLKPTTQPQKEPVQINIEPKLNTSEKSQKVRIIEEILFKPEVTDIITDKLDTDSLKNEQSLKLVFQKQSQDGIYKISNNYTTKNTQVQIAPLKPIKSKAEALKEIPEIKIEAAAIAPPIIPSPEIITEQIKKIDEITTSETKLLPEKTETQNTAAILYTVETQEGFRFSSTSMDELWSKVLEAVQSARLAHKMGPIPSNTLNINNYQLLGLKSNGLKFLIEQLPGANKCTKYKPSFNFQTINEEADDEMIVGHLHGAIRLVPYVRKKEPNDMFGWLASKHRKLENSLVDSELLPR